jgi:hypothetical protein
MSKAETCVCCGRVIPEGSQVCIICGYKVDNSKADVVEVVRCKDCKYYTPIKHPSSKWESKTLYCTRSINAKRNENDFCSYGERESEVDAE